MLKLCPLVGQAYVIACTGPVLVGSLHSYPWKQQGRPRTWAQKWINGYIRCERLWTFSSDYFVLSEIRNRVNICG